MPLKLEVDELADLYRTDRALDAYGKHFTGETERVLRKPRLVVYYPTRVESRDIFGEVIPELSGEYTDELRDRIREHSDEHTESQDFE